jgi:Pyridine nucleotide-disulphide oxidoreductase/Pyridine nucleotide-disulphide oxidoreductase, dimerisation domain
VDGTTYSASRAVVIATATSPSVPPIPGLSEVPYWTNHQAVEAGSLPGSLVVLGGGAVGLELSQVFARFGVKVTVVEAQDRLLPLEEPEAGRTIAEVLRREGVDVRVGVGAEGVSAEGDRIAVALDSGESLAADRLLVAVGRRANLGGLGIDAVGLDQSARWLRTDGHLRAGDGVWAVGDVTGEGAFTHVAMYQAAIATADILRRESAPADYRALPRVTFTDPEVGSVGPTEAQAREQGIAVRTGSALVAHSARGWIHGPGNDGFIKLVEDPARGVLVGATSVGPQGWRGALDADPGGQGRGAGDYHARDDLRVSDLPPGRGGRPPRPGQPVSHAMSDKVRFLRRLNLFEGMSEEEVERVSRELTMRHCEVGEPIGEGAARASPPHARGGRRAGPGGPAAAAADARRHGPGDHVQPGDRVADPCRLEPGGPPRRPRPADRGP